MQKRNMIYRKRRLAIVILIVLVAASAVFCIIFGIIGVPVQKTITTATYTSSSEIKYHINVQDNALYNDANLEFGDGYVTKYIDAISLNLLYNFDCDEATEIYGNYSVTAVLEGSYNNENLIWRKNYALIPEQSLSSGQVSKELILPVKDYMQMADSIETDTGVSTSAKMTISFTVNAFAAIDGLPINDTSISTLVFDLSKDVLVMSGEPAIEQTVNVEDTITEDMLPKKMALISSIILFCLFSGVLVWLLVFTVGIHEDPVKLQLLKIYKKYNSRIVELQTEANINKYEPVLLSTFHDLLLVADELKKPIFKNSTNICKEIEFYVFDDMIVYIFWARSLRTNPEAGNFFDKRYVVSSGT